MLCSVGDDGEVGLGVGDFGEELDGVGVQVLGVGGNGCRGGGRTEAAVEGKAVGGVDGHVLGAGEEGLVREVDEWEDFILVDVGCWPVNNPCSQTDSIDWNYDTYADTWFGKLLQRGARRSMGGHRGGTWSGERGSRGCGMGSIGHPEAQIRE